MEIRLQISQIVTKNKIHYSRAEERFLKEKNDV